MNFSLSAHAQFNIISFFSSFSLDRGADPLVMCPLIPFIVGAGEICRLLILSRTSPSETLVSCATLSTSLPKGR